MKRPERDPDFVHEPWEFFFEEGVQWNSSEKFLYDIKVTKNLDVMFFDPADDSWNCYYNGGDEERLVTNGYLNWLAEKEILCS
jgi:hypothetical protein